MIKYILRLSIAAFIIILAYDTVNFYLTSKNVLRENQLVVVRPAIKPAEKKLEPEPFDYVFKGNPIWYGGLGAAAATGFGVLCYCLSAVCSKRKVTKSDRKLTKDGACEKIGEPQEGVISRSAFATSQKSNSTKIKQDKEFSSQEIMKAIKEDRSNIDTIGTAVPTISDDKVSQGHISTSNVSRPMSRQETSGSLHKRTVEVENEDVIDYHPESYIQGNTCENSEITLGSRVITDSELNSDSKNSWGNDIALITLPEQMIAAMSYLQTTRNVEPFNSSILTKDDLFKIELKLENIETRLSLIENVSKDCIRRIEITETEMIEVQEQMYTVLTKLEQEQKPNYLIVSQMAVIDEAKEEANNDMLKPQMDTNLSVYQHEQDVIMKEKVEKEIENCHQRVQHLGDYVGLKKRGDRPTSRGSGKLKSVGLEAILEKDVPRKSSTAPPKKANPKVPTHVVQPYKRSSFTATDSFSDIKKDCARPQFSDFISRESIETRVMNEHIFDDIFPRDLPELLTEKRRKKKRHTHNLTYD